MAPRVGHRSTRHSRLESVRERWVMGRLERLVVRGSRLAGAALRAKHHVVGSGREDSPTGRSASNRCRDRRSDRLRNFGKAMRRQSDRRLADRAVWGLMVWVRGQFRVKRTESRMKQPKDARKRRRDPAASNSTKPRRSLRPPGCLLVHASCPWASSRSRCTHFGWWDSRSGSR